MEMRDWKRANAPLTAALMTVLLLSGCNVAPDAIPSLPGDAAQSAADKAASLLPSLSELIEKALDSGLAADLRERMLKAAYDAASSDADKTALLDACLGIAENPRDTKLQIQALAIIGKLSVSAAEDVGRKLVEIAMDEKNQKAVRQAALDALEKLDADALRSEIEKAKRALEK